MTTPNTAAFVADMTALAAERAQVLAEANANETLVPPCPSWCTMPAGHRWDSVDDDGGAIRGHRGPDVGRGVCVGADEHGDGRLLHFDASVDIPAEIYTPDELRRMASSLSSAAEWLEAQA